MKQKFLISKWPRRCQLKIQQMAFMLMAITIFFVLVGMFVLVFKMSGLKESATILEEKNAMLLVAKLANSPEFSCGFAYDNSKLACVDADKIMALKTNILKYNNFWDVSNIEIRKIYPATNPDVLCSIGNYPDCSIIRLRSQNISGYDVSNFVSLCRKESSNEEIYNKCEVAKLIVSYAKQ